MPIVKFEEPAEAVVKIMCNIVQSQQGWESDPNADLEVLGEDISFGSCWSAPLKMDERRKEEDQLGSNAKSKSMIRT